MALWTEYKKKSNVDTTDTFLIYDELEGVKQVSGASVKQSFRENPDETLSKTGEAADSKIVGDRFAKVEKTISENTKKMEEQANTISEQAKTLGQKATGKGIEFFYDAARGCMAAKITT